MIGKRERKLSVSFTNLYHGRTGAIEFRFPPPGCKPRHVLCWAEFCGVFVAAVVVCVILYLYPAT